MSVLWLASRAMLYILNFFWQITSSKLIEFNRGIIVTSPYYVRLRVNKNTASANPDEYYIGENGAPSKSTSCLTALSVILSIQSYLLSK
jgi:hypothetical protein